MRQCSNALVHSYEGYQSDPRKLRQCGSCATFIRSAAYMNKTTTFSSDIETGIGTACHEEASSSMISTEMEKGQIDWCLWILALGVLTESDHILLLCSPISNATRLSA